MKHCGTSWLDDQKELLKFCSNTETLCMCKVKARVCTVLIHSVHKLLTGTLYYFGATLKWLALLVIVSISHTIFGPKAEHLLGGS